MRRRSRKKHHLLPLLLALVLLGLAVTVLSRFLHPPEPEDPHAGQVYINDGFGFIWMTPLEGVPVNDLYNSDFLHPEGKPRYIGSRYETRVGIDVSEHQWGIDWKTAAQHMDFAMIRLGYRGYTEGGLFLDPWFEQNAEGALDAGLDVGVYFFSQATTVSEALEEADFVLEHIRGIHVSMPVVFDWEKIEGGGARTDTVDTQVLTDCAVAFCERVRQAGYTPCVYFNRHLGYYDYDLSRLTEYLFWASVPGEYPDFYYAIDLWQYSFAEEIPGVSGPADMNMLFIPIPREEETAGS